MQSRLSQLFRERQVDSYRAVVAGHLAQGMRGEIDLPLITDCQNWPLQKVDFVAGKPSLTRFRREAQCRQRQ